MTIESSPASGSGSTIERPRAVLFDMTGTLHSQHDAVTANRTSLSWLVEDHPDPVLRQVLAALPSGMTQAMAEVRGQPFYLTIDVMMRGFALTLDLAGVSVDPDRWEKFITMTMDGWVDHTTLYPGTLEVLAALRDNGIATGIVSVNDEAPLQRLVDGCGLRPHLDLVLSSEAARSCKPDPRIFEQALAALGVAASEAVFIGDMIDMDIVGANRVGIRSVLTTQGSGVFPDSIADGPERSPDHIITDIRQVLDLLGLSS